MNRTPIEWVHPDPKRRYSLNPLTGCLTGCGYCYARTIVHFRGKRGTETGGLHVAQPGEVYPYGFDPTFYPHRLEEPARRKGPVGIFMVDMGDLGGCWVPYEWQAAVTRLPWDAPRHTYYWLTKHPKGLKRHAFPDNSWVGTTITCAGELWRAEVLAEVEAEHRFLCFEPLLARLDARDEIADHIVIDDDDHYQPFRPPIFDWLIIGALTKNGRTVPPEQGGTRREWVEELVAQADEAGVKVFLKNNLAPLFPGEKLRQEWVI